MKKTSTLAGFVYGFTSMILIPSLLVVGNNSLNLPSFQNTFIQLFGVFSVISGGVLLVYSTRLFAKRGRGGSPLPFDPPKRLVTVGIYKYIRNPMFTASALIWLGEFLFFGSILLFVYALGWVVLNHIHLITQDEKWLAKRFGKEYLDYKKNTHRYIPKLF